MEKLQPLSGIVQTNPNRLDRGREEATRGIRAAFGVFREDDRLEQAVRDGAVKARTSQFPPSSGFHPSGMVQGPG